MCDEQVHTLPNILFCSVLCSAVCTHLLCLPFFKVSSVFVKMTTNKKHKFQFRKKHQPKSEKKKNEYVDETRQEKRTTNGNEHHERFDTIIYHSKLLLFFRAIFLHESNALVWPVLWPLYCVFTVQCF